MSYPKKVTCPYCMESIDNPMIKRNEYGKGGGVNTAKPPPPGDVCDKCHLRIPMDYLYGKVKTLYIYFIGPTSVGKTRLIGNMIMDCMREFGHVGVFQEWTPAPDPNPSNSANGNAVCDFYVRYAMDQNEAATDKTLIKTYPMVLFKVGTCGSALRSVANFSLRKEKVYVAFVDAMGEWFRFEKSSANAQNPFSGTDDDELDKYRKRFSKADAIVLVMEPGHIPGLQGGAIGMPQTDTNIEKILNVTQLSFGDKFKKIPLAIVLSKFDTLFAAKDNLAAQEFLAKFRSVSTNWDTATDFEHDDITKIGAFHKGLKSAILNPQNHNLTSRARKGVGKIILSYPYVSLFAVSSTGMGGLNEVSPTHKKLRPLHVIDPLVWILWQHGYLSSKLFI